MRNPVPVLEDVPVATATLLRTISAVADVLVNVSVIVIVDNGGDGGLGSGR